MRRTIVLPQLGQPGVTDREATAVMSSAPFNSERPPALILASTNGGDLAIAALRIE
jgi:hypothetical protein